MRGYRSIAVRKSRFLFLLFALDTTCYSSLDNGYGYRGSSTYRNCVSWNKSTTFPVHQYAAAGLGDHNYCRNPDPQTRSKPWCYESDGGKRNCFNNAVAPCTKGTEQISEVSKSSIPFVLQMSPSFATYAATRQTTETSASFPSSIKESGFMSALLSIATLHGAR